MKQKAEQLMKGGAEKIDEKLVKRGIEDFLKKYADMNLDEIESFEKKYYSENVRGDVFQVDSKWYDQIRDEIRGGEKYDVQIIEIRTNQPGGRVIFSINGIRYFSIYGKLFQAIKDGKFEM